jgi:hypothetical protein
MVGASPEDIRLRSRFRGEELTCVASSFVPEEDSVLLVVDIQERLAAAMLPEVREQ